jgi:thiosulfate reductase cytochrome b subunit
VMQKLYVHPLPVRIWHWINAFGIVFLILTGLQIRYVGLIDVVSFRTAVTLHNWTGFALMANFLLWLFYYLSSDRIKVYHPELSPKEHFRRSFAQLMYYGYGIFKGAPNPHEITIYRKFNPMQSMTYQVIMLFLLPLQFYTGLLLWDVKRFAGQVEFFGGVRVVDTIHVLIFIFFVAYVMVHIYLGSLGHTPSAHFKAMVTGYEEVEEPHDPLSDAPASPKHG